MKNDLDALGRGRNTLVGAQVSLDQLDVKSLEVRSIPGREVVVNPDLVPVVKESPDQVGADKAGSAGYEDPRHADPMPKWRDAWSEPATFSHSCVCSSVRADPSHARFIARAEIARTERRGFEGLSGITTELGRTATTARQSGETTTAAQDRRCVATSWFARLVPRRRVSYSTWDPGVRLDPHSI